MKKMRPKAQDIFNESTFVWGEKTTFENAFPTVQECIVEVEESGHVEPNTSRKRTYRNPGEYINCSNRYCYNGGFDIGSEIREMVRKMENEREGNAICQGAEASPKGKRIHRKCINFFKYKISLKLKATDNKG